MGYKIKYFDKSCDVCGKIFPVHIVRLKKKESDPKFIIRCKECYSLYRSKQSKEQWKNMTDEDYNNICNNMSKGTTKQWENYSDDKKLNVVLKISKMRSEFWKDKDDEYRKEHGRKHSLWWKSLTDEEKKRILNPLHQASIEHFRNLSDDEKKAFSDAGKYFSNLYWENISKEEKYKWIIKQTNGLQRYFNENHFDGNKTEIEFKNIMHINNIKYDFQYFNKLKDPLFDQLFPKNNIIDSSIIKPFHAWDFILYLRNKSILVDIDGSIHDPHQVKNYIIKYHNGKIFNLFDYTLFLDSQRPYQTDGLDAYIIKAYNDKIEDDTIVQNVKTNEEIKFKNFINILSFDNLYEKDKKEIIKSNL